MYPNLGEPVSRTGDKELSFYVSLYPAAGHPLKQVTLELLHNGRRVATGRSRSVRARKPDPAVGRAAPQGVPPGTYELKVTATDDQTRTHAVDVLHRRELMPSSRRFPSPG